MSGNFTKVISAARACPDFHTHWVVLVGANIML